MSEDAHFPGKLTAKLDELTAFDAMRAFLQAYWERGDRSDEGIALLLTNLDRNVWADGGPSDPAMWKDWQDAIAQVRNRKAP